MPSLQHRVVAALVGRLRHDPPARDVPRLRAHLAEANRGVVERPPGRVRRGRRVRVDVDHGFPVTHLWPRGEAEPRRALLWLHGGAYCKPADARHWEVATRLGDAIGARTVLPAYPLAPEHTVADSFDALVDLHVDLAEQHPDGVVLAGDSAGGGYALAIAQALRDRGLAAPSRLVLVSPWVDLTSTTAGTARAARRDPWLSLAHLLVYARFWVGSDDLADLADPRVSPLHGDLRDLPRALLLCGTRDLVHPQSLALFDGAEAAGWDLTYVEGPGLIHVYPLLPVPEGAAAVRTIVEFCQAP